MRLRLALAGFGLLAATPAAAQLRAVPEQPATELEALRGVEVFLVNEGAAPVDAEGPKEIEITAADGTRLVLERMPMPHATVAPGAFYKARYVPVQVAGKAIPPSEQHPAAPMAESGETTVASSTGASSGFLDRFEPHEPIYGVLGASDAGAKLQVSFAFRPFAGDAPLKLGNLRFGYTQTMFWALNEPSGPFRSTTYSPEIYADIPVTDSATVALGYRHDSNGRGVERSVDVNRLFVRLEKRFDLGDDWRLDVVPQGWIYLGNEGTATRLRETWGYNSLTAAIQKQDGIRIAATARGSYTSGRAGGELFVSYPLARLGGLGFYLFGEAWTGFGESLDGYEINDTHARIGISLTR